MTKQMLNNRKASIAATVEACEEIIPNQKDISMNNNTTLSKEIQNVSNFNFGEASIRVVSINGEPWFVAKDICDAIGIENNRKALLVLDDDEKGVTLSNTLGGQQEMNIVSESGMYTLILRCRDAVKKDSTPYRFRKWVTSEVLPQIRKTGKYEKLDTPILLTKEHQQFIKDFVKNRTLQLPKDKQAKCAIMQWSALKSHFGKSYKEIDDSQFVDAISLLARLPLEGELIIDEFSQDEEALYIIANLYHSLREAYEMGQKIRKGYPYLRQDIDKKLGGHYFHNLNIPTEQALEKAKKYVHAKSERIMFIKGMLSLLEQQPQPKRLANF
ncbi:BRO-N domain-containing protein [Pasteurella langaaensis]